MEILALTLCLLYFSDVSHTYCSSQLFNKKTKQKKATKQTFKSALVGYLRAVSSIAYRVKRYVSWTVLTVYEVVQTRSVSASRSTLLLG